MSIFNFIARWGTVGGTARWAARGYLQLRRQYPDPAAVNDSQISRFLIACRYRLLPDAAKSSYLLSQCDGIQGLLGLVVEILKVEANLHENQGDTIYNFLKIIDEELQRFGVEPVVRYGRFKDFSDFGEQAMTPPNSEAIRN